MSEEVAGPVRSRAKRRAGIVGAVLGVVAAGVAAGVTAERVLVGRRRREPDDPHADEPFGPLPYDESMMVATETGLPVYVEVVDPTDGVEFDADFTFGAGGRSPAPEPTVVFVHGFCLDMGTFYFQRKELTRRGEWRAVYYDQPGHGRSGRTQAGEYELPGLAQALHTVLTETVPEGPIVLVGHSMGGMTVMALAEAYPDLFTERVVGVVLVSSSAGRLRGTNPSFPEMVTRIGRPLLPLINGATRLTGGMIDRGRRASTDLAWMLTRRYGFGSEKPSAALVSFVEGMNSKTQTETVVRYLRTLYTHARYPVLQSLQDKPVLLICGDQDAITPLANSEEMKRHLPDAELLVVPGTGHMVMMEQAELVNEAIQSFLEKVE